MIVAKCIERMEISLLKNNDMPKTATIDLLCNLFKKIPGHKSDPSCPGTIYSITMKNIYIKNEEPIQLTSGAGLDLSINKHVSV